MASHDEVSAALAAARKLQETHQGRFALALTLMADHTWEGGSSHRFLTKLRGMDQRHKQQLEGLVSDLEQLLAHTPKSPVPEPPSRWYR